MGCEEAYAKLTKQTPEELIEKTSTGVGNMNLLLRIRAANFWHESLVTLSESQLYSYCTQMIDFQYPNLKKNNEDLYRHLAFELGTAVLEDIYYYQWWLCFVIGPRSCNRDISYLCSLLDISVNEEWSSGLEETVLQYQKENSFIEEITGYGCAETFKRLRLQE